MLHGTTQRMAERVWIILYHYTVKSFVDNMFSKITNYIIKEN